MNCKWLSVTIKDWVTQKLHWRKRKLLTYKGRMPLLDNERFQYPPAYSVRILALVSELFFFCISYMFTSVCEYHGNVSSECHCITATPRKILIHHPWLFSLQISTYTDSDCLLPTRKEKQSHTQISVPPTSSSLNFCIEGFSSPLLTSKLKHYWCYFLVCLLCIILYNI